MFIAKQIDGIFGIFRHITSHNYYFRDLLL
jgi:hypothetical protein